LREHSILNVCGVIVTTNNKDSMHLPSDDRRHFVAWTTLKKENFVGTTGPSFIAGLRMVAMRSWRTTWALWT
jgi:hypothetical protein